jgi:dUTP pyrophosphatase
MKKPDKYIPITIKGSYYRLDKTMSFDWERYAKDLEIYIERLEQKTKIDMTKVKIKLAEGVALPKYETKGAAAMDVTFHQLKKIYYKDVELTIEEDNHNDLILSPYQRALISTGISVKIPEGYYIELVPRSGNGLKRGISFTNSVGIIDSDYTGEIGLIIENNTGDMMHLKEGERLGQIILKKKETIEWEVVEELDKTDRGEKGFGSTGK